jgi:membrane protease YdiL (CAAX protease family)
LTGFILLFILLDRIPALLAGFDRTAGFLLASAVSVVCAVAVDVLIFRRTLPAAWRHLGFGRPDKRTTVVTTLITTVMLAFYPIFSLITGAPFTLPKHWLWVLVGLIAIHGIAEEVLFRGFVFHNLRANRSFGRAALLSLLIFAAAHVYLFTYMPPVLALFATVLALASSYAFAYLFERGNNTIWAPAILHTQVHSISLFVTSEKFVVSAGIVWMIVWIAAVLMMYGFREYLFDESDEAIIHSAPAKEVNLPL